jgi:hypothetical protein
MRISSHRSLFIGIVALCRAAALDVQQPPVIHDLTGTIATEATIKDEHKAANKIGVKTEDGTEDGVEHIFDGARISSRQYGMTGSLS